MTARRGVLFDINKGDLPYDMDLQGANQPAQVAQDTAATLTVAQIIAGIITSNPAGAINLQLPLASAMDGAYPQFQASDCDDFFVINTNGTNAATVTTNTGWTTVGSMAVAANASGHFRARKTGVGAWTLFRLS